MSTDAEEASVISTSDEIVRKDPPRNILGLLKELGPGVIMVSCVIGSGELIATTSCGGKAGFSLLWVIVLGAMIKFWIQLELGRYAIISHESTLAAIHHVPCPSIPLCKAQLPLKAYQNEMHGHSPKNRRISFLSCFVFIQVFFAIFIQTAILTGVGQTMALAIPLTDQGRAQNAANKELILKKIEAAENGVDYSIVCGKDRNSSYATTVSATSSSNFTYEELCGDGGDVSSEQPWDVAIWVAIVVALTIPLFVTGNYKLIERLSSVFLVVFMVLCITSVALIQTQPAWRISWSELGSGLVFQLPQEQTSQALSLSMSAFGMIGAGSSELLAYSYWLLDKGYARNVGRRPFNGKKDVVLEVITGGKGDSELARPLKWKEAEENTTSSSDEDAKDVSDSSWESRAQSWIGVMRVDLGVSTVAITFTTAIFYLLGAAVLNPLGLAPEGPQMIVYLTTMFRPAFGNAAIVLFLTGSFFVFFSSYFISVFINSKFLWDIIDNLYLLPKSYEKMVKRIFFVTYPILLLIFCSFGGQDPAMIVLVLGAGSTILLPVLGGVALYFRFYKCPAALRPSIPWDVMLFFSEAVLLVTSALTVYLKFQAFLNKYSK